MRRVLFCALACLLFASCGGFTVNRLMYTSYPAERTFSGAEVRVYSPTDSIPEHTRIALLVVKGTSQFQKLSQVVDRLRVEAGALGANAIILYLTDSPGIDEKIGATLFAGKDANPEGQAVAIHVSSFDEKTR